MAKNYIYRMDHDTGFAPHVDKEFCFLSGFKKKTIEKWAKVASWVIGLGGNKTWQPNKLIYVMEVDKNLSYSLFKTEYRDIGKYLKPINAGTNVLISKRFWYFGDKAINMLKKLEHIIIDRQGYKCVSDKDIEILKGYLAGNSSFNIPGKSNNPVLKQVKKIC